MTWTQRIDALASIKDDIALTLRNPGAVIFDDDMQVIAILAGGNLHKFKTILTSVVQKIAHDFHKIVFLADENDLW
ncbi:hypothetical protein D3C87_2116070 [compost metagenome]